MRKILEVFALICCIFYTVSYGFTQSGNLQPWQIWSNPSASSAPSRGASLSTLIDGGIPCTAPGSIIFRGSVTWDCVALGTVTSGLNVLAASLLATNAVLPNTPTYANGTAGVGATLTSATNTTLTVDSTAAPLNTVVLVKNQASAFQNGIYSVTQAGSGSVPWILTRVTYFDQAAEMKSGSYTFITGGVANINSSWVLQTAVTTVGTDPLNWAFFSSVGAAVASLGGANGVITLGNCLSVPSNTLTLCLGVDTNTLRSATSGPDTILTTDCGKTVQEGSGTSGQWTITLPAVGSFDARCQITVVNGDTGIGKILTGFPGSMTSPTMLWPGQQVRLKIVNGVWVAANPGRWATKSQVTIHVDPAVGNNANDGLAAGAGRAVADPQQAFNNIINFFDLQAHTPIIAMACSQTHTVQLAMGGTPGIGTNLVQLSPDGNCAFTWQNAAQCIVLSDLAELDLRFNQFGAAGNVTWTCNQTAVAHIGAIYLHNEAVLDQESSIPNIWNPSGSADNLVVSDGTGAQFTWGGGVTQATGAGAAYMFEMQAGGHATIAGPITASGSGGLTGLLFEAGGAVINFGATGLTGWSGIGASKVLSNSTLWTNGISIPGGATVGSSACVSANSASTTC